MQRILRDHGRFREIVRGRIKSDLRRYMKEGELLGQQGGHLISIPIPQIHLPQIRFGPNQPGQGGAQGEGEQGGDGGEGGVSTAGDRAGQHLLEVEVELEELARILGEELELPDIQPRGRRMVETVDTAYNGIARTGPQGLRHFKRSFHQALRRQVAAGRWDPDRPVVVPEPDDLRYRSIKSKAVPQSSAVVIYMMDVSGSMGREQKEIVRIAAFWLDTWLRSQYSNLEVRYVVHDAVAKEVDQHTFFHLRESGGTKISSAYELCLDMIEKEFPPEEWNIYPFHFSDGDNWSARDTERCLGLLEGQILPQCNMFCYGQVRSAYGSGQFRRDLVDGFTGDERVLTCEVADREAIMDAIRLFLGTGK